MKERRALGTRGFTMVEMVVAVGLFTTLMLIIVGSFLSITDVARKTRSTRIALDNVSAAVDYMAREIRLGSYFHCETDIVLGPGYPGLDPDTQVSDCPYGAGGLSPGLLLAFEGAAKKMFPLLGHEDDQIVFWAGPDLNGVNRIYRSTQSGASPEELTAPEINITQLFFYVEGTNYSAFAGADANQPRITIVIRGLAGGSKVKTQVPFSLQTTLSARTPNIPAPS